MVDLPLLSNAEQCADVCMRLRAEYLYNTGQYGSIRFQDVNGHTLRYQGRPLDRTKGSHRRTVEVENEDGTKKRVPDWDGDYVSVFIPLKGDTITLEDGWTM